MFAWAILSDVSRERTSGDWVAGVIYPVIMNSAIQSLNNRGHAFLLTTFQSGKKTFFSLPWIKDTLN